MLTIRPLNANDLYLVFNWRNDPEIVNLGSLKRSVTWDEHLIWFNTTLIGLNRKAFILEINDMPVGQIRFDKKAFDSCLISVYLSKVYSGKGYGIEFINLGCKKINSEWDQLKKIYALVRIDNIIGQKAFIKAGFIEDESNQDQNHFSFLLICS